MAQETASTLLSRSHNQQDESLKVCQVAFAAGKQPELSRSKISSTRGERMNTIKVRGKQHEM